MPSNQGEVGSLKKINLLIWLVSWSASNRLVEGVGICACSAVWSNTGKSVKWVGLLSWSKGWFHGWPFTLLEGQKDRVYNLYECLLVSDSLFNTSQIMIPLYVYSGVHGGPWRQTCSEHTHRQEYGRIYSHWPRWAYSSSLYWHDCKCWNLECVYYSPTLFC